MTNPPDLTKFRQRLAERRAKEAEEEKKRQQEHKSNTQSFDEDLIPEATYELSDADKEIDRIVDGITVLEAYQRWCGKMIPVVRGGQREGIKISCPIPGHIDSDPSAWINLDKETWYCGGCQEGGDKFDIAAYYTGFPVPDYKSGNAFHKLRERMAVDFGYIINRHPGGEVTITPPVIVEEPPARPAVDPPLPDVATLYEDDEDEEIEMPSLDWRPVTPQGTFLDEYMKATVVDDVPEEYHFFHALIALGFAIGREVTLFDSVPVYGNLFVCTLGRSGAGKSKARKHLDRLLASALPYDRRSVPSKGVLRVNAPGSAESLIYQFMEPVEDPTDPKKVAYYAPVRGLIDFNELSSLVSRTNRMGSVMKPTLMQFYDMDDIVQSTSMTTGSKEAHKPFASTLTTSQPMALKTLLDIADDHSGFLNRWLFVPGKEKERFSVGGVTVDMSGAVKPLQEVHAWASTFRGGDQIEWSEEAYKLWDKFFHGVLEPERRTATNNLMVRVDLTLKKLMLLFAANRKEKTLSEQSVADALYCYKYLKAAYGIPEAQIGNTLNNEISETLMRQIEKYTAERGGITASQIWQNIKHKKYDRKKVMEGLEVLVKMGLVEIESVNQGRVGRPSVRYKNAG